MDSLLEATGKKYNTSESASSGWIFDFVLGRRMCGIKLTIYLLLPAAISVVAAEVPSL